MESEIIAREFFGFVQANGMAIAVLLNAGLREHFYPPLRDIMHGLYAELFRSQASHSMSMDYVSDFTASGMLALAIRWIATGMHESVDEMAKIATEMTDAQHANL